MEAISTSVGTYKPMCLEGREIMAVHSCYVLTTFTNYNISLLRLMMSTTFLELSFLTLNRGSSTGSSTPPTPSSTTTRTSTCLSMGEGQETTGPVDTTRYSDSLVPRPLPVFQCFSACNIEKLGVAWGRS